MTTSGSQTFNGPVQLTNSDTLTSTSNGNVTFSSTLDGTTSGVQSLTISNGSGSTTFDGAVGGSTALGSVTVTSGTITQQSSLNVVGNLTDNGTTYLKGDVTTTGNQTYNGAVHLTNSDTLTSTGNGSVTFASTLDGTTKCEQSLTLITGTGRTTFDGAVGGVISLKSLSVSGPSTLDGNVTTCGTQTYLGPVTLGANDTLTTMNSDVTFGTTVDGPYALTVAAGSGTVTYTGVFINGHYVAVGGTTPLTSLDDSGGLTVLKGDVTTTGNQTYNGAVQVYNVITITSRGGGDIEFYGTLDGPGGLIVYTTGLAEFHGAVGGSIPVNPFKVPGAEAHPIVFDVTPPVKILHFPESQVVNDVLHDTITALALVINTDRDIQVAENVITSERLVFFKITAPDNTSKTILLKELDLDDLLGAIRKNKATDQSILPDGMYEILVQEPGDTSLRTVLEFKIVNGSIDDGSESTSDPLPSSSESGQPALDSKPIEGDSAVPNTPVPENPDATNKGRDGASIDSTIFSNIQMIASAESSIVIDRSFDDKPLVLTAPRFGAKSGRIEWNYETDANEEQGIDAAADQESEVNDANDSMDDNSDIVVGNMNQTAGAVMFCSATSLVISGVGRLKDESDGERNYTAAPRLNRAARILRKSFTFRGVSR